MYPILYSNHSYLQPVRLQVGGFLIMNILLELVVTSADPGMFYVVRDRPHPRTCAVEDQHVTSQRSYRYMSAEKGILKELPKGGEIGVSHLGLSTT